MVVDSERFRCWRTADGEVINLSWAGLHSKNVVGLAALILCTSVVSNMAALFLFSLMWLGVGY